MVGIFFFKEKTAYVMRISDWSSDGCSSDLEAIERHAPDRIVTLGGDCLVDLAPMAYLSRRYGEKLGVLWLDAHPDVMSAAEFSHAHAHVLALLLGRGDEAFTAEVPRKLD